MRLAAIALLIVLLPTALSAQPRILDVGPGRVFSMPSAAAAAARPGDVIRIAPGTYRVTLSANGKTVSKSITVKQDPRVKSFVEFAAANIVPALAH